MSTESSTIDIDRDIGNFFYDVTAKKDAGVGLTEKTIDYIVEAKQEPDWIRELAKRFLQIVREARSQRAT